MPSTESSWSIGTSTRRRCTRRWSRSRTPWGNHSLRRTTKHTSMTPKWHFIPAKNRCPTNQIIRLVWRLWRVGKAAGQGRPCRRRRRCRHQIQLYATSEASHTDQLLAPSINHNKFSRRSQLHNFIKTLAHQKLWNLKNKTNLSSWTKSFGVWTLSKHSKTHAKRNWSNCISRTRYKSNGTNRSICLSWSQSCSNSSIKRSGLWTFQIQRRRSMKILKQSWMRRCRSRKEAATKCLLCMRRWSRWTKSGANCFSNRRRSCKNRYSAPLHFQSKDMRVCKIRLISNPMMFHRTLQISNSRFTISIALMR